MLHKHKHLQILCILWAHENVLIEHAIGQAWLVTHALTRQQHRQKAYRRHMATNAGNEINSWAIGETVKHAADVEDRPEGLPEMCLRPALTPDMETVDIDEASLEMNFGQKKRTRIIY